jgi:glutamate-1-semialdehyde 2,1-aminomutase
MDSEQAYARAQQIMPGGVSSPVRAYGSVGGTPVFLDRAEGARVFDVSGRPYLDLVGSWGPALLGHAHPEVVAAVTEAAARGLSFGAPTWGEVALAEEVGRRVPAAEKVRFVSTGTEATMTALRLARAATGRDLIVKFAGCYHGHSDGLLAAAGSGVATAGLPGSAGVTAATAGQTIVVAYNDLDALAATFAANPGRIAAVITEPAAANMGVVPPEPGFNEGVRRLCTEHGAMFIFDEVLTGFRVSPAGWWGLEAPGGDWEPDLFTFGKVVGGGMPLAAVGGRRELMDMLAPVGPVYQAGTLSGNPLATAAGLATLRLADDSVYEAIDAASLRLSEAVGAALSASGVPHRVQRAGSLFSVFWGEGPAGRPVRDYAAAQSQDAGLFAAFFHQMLDDGVMLPPSAFEAWFMSAAHDDEILGQIEAALPRAADAAASAWEESRGRRAGAGASGVGASETETPVGRAVLVGGGPGDPGLMTLAGLAELRQADVVLHDHLAPLALLGEARPDAEIVDVGKLPRGEFTPQEEINRLIVEHARAGRRVLRFKGGDSFVFGRGGEEVQACMAAGIPVTVIPGVSSSIAGPELAGIPVTHRGLSQGFTVVSAHVGPDSPDSTLNWRALATSGTTLVVLMGVKTLPEVCRSLVEHGLAPDTPAAIIENAGHPEVRVVRATVSTLPGEADAAAIVSPAVTVIGDVVGLALEVESAFG